jgi:hypothetical protein
MSIRLSEDNHDSWGTCTTSTECKTVITVVLTVMSGVDPHMISGTWDWFGLVHIGLVWQSQVGLVRWLSRPSAMDFAVRSRSRFGSCGVCLDV